MSIPFVFKSKADILTALEARRADAERVDREALAKHKKDELAYLKAFRAACREAMKWSYEEAKKKSFSVEVRDPESRGNKKHYGGYGAPSCPDSRVTRLERVIALVQRFPDTQKRYTISSSGQYSTIWAQLANDLPERKEMC